MELFTIGDSISQGFMSLAAARTDLSYSTLIAKILKADPYHYPEWPCGGHPANMEEILRKLNKKLGTNINRYEWIRAFYIIGKYVDEVEEYYERGQGNVDNPYQNGQFEYFHNIAVRGFDVGDAWKVNAELCREVINAEKKQRKSNLYGIPSKSFYRTALQVLNPARKPEYDRFTALDWLDYHHNKNEKEKGVKNLVLWLGANNVLSTVLYMKINPTPNRDDYRPHELDRLTREKEGWNLWHPEDFKLEYKALIQQVDKIMQENNDIDWKVFVGTVPHITIAPFAKGVGPSYRINVNGEFRTYFKYYTYLPFEYEFAHKSDKKITIDQALYIDACIDKYNDHIRKIIRKKNDSYSSHRYYIVDLCDVLSRLAVKRNDYQVSYKFPDFFRFQYPPVNTKYYHADRKGQFSQGGLFSLDGVHPSAIGQGLIAWEFLKVMGEARNKNWQEKLNWQEIFDSDSLYNRPISLMPEIYEHDKLANFIVKFVQLFRD